MNELINAVVGMDPLGVVFTILSGVVTGYLFKDIIFPWKVIVLWTAFWLPFYVTRAVFIATIGVQGSGIVGVLLTALYILSSYASRKIGQRFFDYHPVFTLDAEADSPVDNT